MGLLAEWPGQGAWGVIATVASYSGEITSVEFWDGANNTWVSSPPTVTLSSKVGVRATVKNTSSVKAGYVVAIAMRRPDGSIYGAATTKSGDLDPGGTTQHSRQETSDMVGQWGGRVVLGIDAPGTYG